MEAAKAFLFKENAEPTPSSLKWCEVHNIKFFPDGFV